MDKIIGLDEWVLGEAVSDKERLVEASIHLEYPDLSTLKDLLPSKRKKSIDYDLRSKFRD